MKGKPNRNIWWSPTPNPEAAFYKDAFGEDRYTKYRLIFGGGLLHNLVVGTHHMVRVPLKADTDGNEAN